MTLLRSFVAWWRSGAVCRAIGHLDYPIFIVSPLGVSRHFRCTRCRQVVHEDWVETFAAPGSSEKHLDTVVKGA